MLYVSDIISRFNGKLLCGDENMILDNFCKDTRIIKNGDIYVGIKGESFDGNNFYADAFDKGAKACILDNTTLVDTDRYGDKTIILVDNTLECIGKLAKYKRSLLNIPVVAITGSVGKTSTKDMVASVLSTKYKVLKTEGNNNNNIGLPFTILRYKDEDVMVIEMGMNHFGEISYLTDIVRPTIGVITNIGTAHIGILGSRENILKAKLEIIEGLNGPLIINNDKVYVHIINDKKAKGRFLDYGLRRMIKEVINEQIKKNNIDSYRPLKVIINIDEQSTKSNGYYNLQDGLMEELKYGIKNFNYDNVFTPIVHDKLDLHIKYQDSSKSYLVQAADLISGTIRRMVLNEDDVNEFLNFKIILPWKKAT